MFLSAELKGCVMWSYSFFDLLLVRYNCAKFHHCRICVTDFLKGAFFPLPLPIRKQHRKNPSWIGLSQKRKRIFDIFLINFLQKLIFKLLTFKKFIFFNLNVYLSQKRKKVFATLKKLFFFAISHVMAKIKNALWKNYKSFLVLFCNDSI